MSEEMENVLQLIDEDGDEQDFEIIDVVEMDQEEYLLLTPVTEEEYDDDEDVPVLIVKVIHGDEEDELEAVTDDDLMEKIFNEFMESIEDDDEE